MSSWDTKLIISSIQNLNQLSRGYWDTANFGPCACQVFIVYSLFLNWKLIGDPFPPKMVVDCSNTSIAQYFYIIFNF